MSPVSRRRFLTTTAAVAGGGLLGAGSLRPRAARAQGSLKGTKLTVIAGDAREKLLTLDGVEDAEVTIVWDPPWHQSMITADGRRISTADGGFTWRQL
jgi:hypothetical protein